MLLSVRINHNYTISVIDSKTREISFRDLRGSDLEFIDSLLKEEGENTTKEFTLDQIISILSMLCTKTLDFRLLPRRVIIALFDHVKKHILCNYMSKYSWLNQCYSVQNGSFAEISAMEEVPMSKFIAMIQIHSNAIKTVEEPTL